MKKMRTITVCILTVLAMQLISYGIQLNQPTELIAVPDRGTVIVKNFPLTREGKLKWWLKHKELLKIKYGVDAKKNIIDFKDLGTGFIVEGTDVAPFWAMRANRTDIVCFPEIKLIANCLEKGSIFTVLESQYELGNSIYRSYVDDKGYFRYSKEHGIQPVKD